MSCGFDWHFTQTSVTSCFISLTPSKKMYSLAGEWSLISYRVIVCCFHCAPCCCAAGYVVSSQSQTEVTDRLSIHPCSSKRPLGPYKEIPTLRIKKSWISNLITNRSLTQQTQGEHLRIGPCFYTLTLKVSSIFVCRPPINGFLFELFTFHFCVSWLCFNGE